MPTKQQLDKAAWDWAETVSPDWITQAHIETAYRVKLKSCKPNTCRRNCKGNPHCLNGLGEKGWMQDIADEEWHEVDDPNFERRQKDSFVGLKNLGATCYVNSLIQVWYHNPSFRKAIYQWVPEGDAQNNASPDKDTSVDRPYIPASCLGHLQLLFALLQFSSRRYIDPTPFINCLGLSTTQQQDAQEFCRLFMAFLESKLSSQTNPAVRSIVQEQYSGEYAYIIKCHQCLTESATTATFYELDLHIKGHKDLHDCLEEFLQEEKLEGSNQYYCNRCQKKQNATRSVRLMHLPPVINMQLLRFVFDRQSGCKKKLNSFIRFPEILDMSKYLPNSENATVYDLCAVLIHRGPSAYSGHYVAHIKKRASGAWFKFNDETVEKMEGKKLQLGTEENLSEDGGTKPSSKLPKLSKGYHASNNAYMLVYEKRNSQQEAEPGDSPVDWGLPEYLQEAVYEDNSKFEEWVTELAEMREQNVMAGKARQSEIRALYEMLPVKEGAEYEWVNTEWLVKWLSSERENVPQIDNSPFLCQHGKLNPDRVSKMKCISIEASDEIYKKYGGGPRIRDGLCRACVESHCRVSHIKSRLQEDNKVLASLFKIKVSDDEPAYWIGKASLRSWRRMVLKQQNIGTSVSRIEVANLDDGMENMDEAISSSGEMNEKLNLQQLGMVDEETEEDSQYSFNEDLLCEHENLSVDESNRRLIQAEAWRRLKAYFSSAPEFPKSAEICPECQKQQVEDKQTKDMHRRWALEQKSCLQELYLDRARPKWTQLNLGQVVYIVNRHFVEEWRRFVRDPNKREPVREVTNILLVCDHHDGLLYPPQATPDLDPESRLVLVWQHEWENILRLFMVDREIRAWTEKVEENVEIISIPGLCEDCYLSRLQQEHQQLLKFTNAKIYIRRVSTLDDANTDSPLQDTENKDCKEEGQKEDDPEFLQGIIKKKKNVNGLEVITAAGDCQLRRSTRRRRQRGEKEIVVSSNQTLKDLKVQIMRLFSVAPYDQHLILNGKHLTDNQASLASLHILPGALILLRADEPSEEAIVMEDYLKASSPETGFKGTELMKS